MINKRKAADGVEIIMQNMKQKEVTYEDVMSVTMFGVEKKCDNKKENK